jgi:hypothetical protein
MSLITSLIADPIEKPGAGGACRLTRSARRAAGGASFTPCPSPVALGHGPTSAPFAASVASRPSTRCPGGSTRTRCVGPTRRAGVMARCLRQSILAERFHFSPGELPALPGQQPTE